MKKTSRCTTMKIQNLQTKLCQHKSPTPSKPFHIRKMVKKGCGQHEKSFFLRIKKSSRTTVAMIPKIKNVIENQKKLRADVQTYVQAQCHLGSVRPMQNLYKSQLLAKIFPPQVVEKLSQKHEILTRYAEPQGLKIVGSRFLNF